MVDTPRPLCYGCTRDNERAAVATKPCMRCHETQPMSAYAYGGRAWLCDNCRWSAKMTPEEEREARRRERHEAYYRNLPGTRRRHRRYAQANTHCCG